MVSNSLSIWWEGIHVSRCRIEARPEYKWLDIPHGWLCGDRPNFKDVTGQSWLSYKVQRIFTHKYRYVDELEIKNLQGKGR